MGDDKLPLVDVNTEHVEVIQGLQAWITSFVQEYGVDGLRIDGEFRFNWLRHSQSEADVERIAFQPPNTSDPSSGSRSVRLLECSVWERCTAITLRESKWSGFKAVSGLSDATRGHCSVSSAFQSLGYLDSILNVSNEGVQIMEGCTR